MSAARQYYKSLLKVFFRLCYESWRREAAVSVAVTIITLFLTYREQGTWHTTWTALKANIILLFVFVVIHAFRAPWVVHSQTAALIPKHAVQLESGRIFVGDGINEAYLAGLFQKNTEIRARQLLEPHRGKWMRASGKVADVSELPSAKPEDRYFVSLEGTPTLHFNERHKDRVLALRKGDEITAVGKVARASSFSLALEECELEDV